MTTLTESRPPASGQQHSYTLDPGPNPGCEVRWMINDQDVTLSSRVGGLEVKGFGASGTMTVEVVGDAAETTVTAVVICPGSRDVVGPMLVGSGTWAPPVGPGIPVNPGGLVLQVSEWSWWRRMFGYCPDSWWIGGVKCTCDQPSAVTGIWPVYYEISCTFTCPPFQITTLTWTLSFGVIVSGPE